MFGATILIDILGCSDFLWECTSNMPKYLPRVPLTPASSKASLSAVVWDSSVGSIPPPGTTHFSLSLLLVTSNNWKERKSQTSWIKTHLHYLRSYFMIKILVVDHYGSRGANYCTFSIFFYFDVTFSLYNKALCMIT